MRRRYLLWTVPWIVLWLSACTTLLRPPVAHPPLQTSAIDLSKACANWRWIGIKRDLEGACPDLAGWKARPLFDQLDPPKYRFNAQAVETSEAAAELGRFCVYEAEGPQAQGAPPASPGLVRIDRDCSALAPSAPPGLEAVTREPFAAHFLSQVVGPPGTMAAVGGPPGVRLAIVDSQPTGRGVPGRSGRSRHGYTLAHIARHLVCGKDGCAAEITTRMALRVVRFHPWDRRQTIDGDEPDEEGRRGGFVGTLGDLATAITDEVSDWQAQDPGRPLVLNLSVAWDGRLFGGLEEKRVCEMPAAVQAVYRALEYASGQGALVLAAAGNRQYGPYPSPHPRSGPLLPAAWEGRREEEGCGRPRKEPLLYAVGGVQSEGWPLANARIGGLPRRVAYADHAVVAPPGGADPTAVYTGSSVATTVVASIAAVVWKAHPHLDAQGLMEILDASGDVRPYPANFWFGAPEAPPVRQLSLCPALEVAACDPAAPKCRERARARCGGTPERPRLSSLLPPPPPRSHRSSRVSPSDRYFGITSQPWLFPQPGDTPCPNCVIVPPPPDKELMDMALAADKPSSPPARSYELHGVIPEGWRGGCLTDATLDIERFDPPDSTTRRISVDLGPSYRRGGEAFVHRIEIPPDVQIDERTTMTLGFVVRETCDGPESGAVSAQSPVFIAR